MHIIDLGITLEDINNYNIVPEDVPIKNSDTDKLKNITDSKYKEFFDGGSCYHRVELNAFTTKQILDLIDSKLSTIDNRPKINLRKSINIDINSFKKKALYQLISEKYGDVLDHIIVTPDLANYSEEYKIEEAEEKVAEIIDSVLDQYKELIKKEINIFDE